MFTRSKLTGTNVAVGLSAAALVVAVFGATPVGQAASRLILPKGSVGATQLKKNAVTGLKVKDGSLLATDFKTGQLPAGPKGDPGPQGPRGEPGGAANVLWVVVTPDAKIDRQSGQVTELHHAATGAYSVYFNKDVSQCAFIAELGAPGANGSPAGEISSERISAQQTHSVLVKTRDSAGAFSDRPFHLAVFC